jgi:hypothetical protein
LRWRRRAPASHLGRFRSSPSAPTGSRFSSVAKACQEPSGTPACVRQRERVPPEIGYRHRRPGGRGRGSHKRLSPMSSATGARRRRRCQPDRLLPIATSGQGARTTSPLAELGEASAGPLTDSRSDGGSSRRPRSRAPPLPSRATLRVTALSALFGRITAGHSRRLAAPACVSSRNSGFGSARRWGDGRASSP